MADKPAIRARAIARVAQKKKRAATFSDVVAAFQASTSADRQAFATAYATGSPSELMQRMDSVMSAWATSESATEVDAALADDNLTLDEFEALFT